MQCCQRQDSETERENTASSHILSSPGASSGTPTGNSKAGCRCSLQGQPQAQNRARERSSYRHAGRIQHMDSPIRIELQSFEHIYSPIFTLKPSHISVRQNLAYVPDILLWEAHQGTNVLLKAARETLTDGMTCLPHWMHLYEQLGGRQSLHLIPTAICSFPLLPCHFFSFVAGIFFWSGWKRAKYKGF